MPFRNWGKQLYLALGPIYPSVSFFASGMHTDFFWSKWSDPTTYHLKESHEELFEQELVKVSDSMEMPFEDVRITITPTYELSDKVHGIIGFSCGADYSFPVRMLVDSADEFREHIAEMVKGATGHEFQEQMTKLIADADINGVLLTEAARRFVFRRSIIESTAYTSFTTHYVVWAACLGVCYGVFVLFNKFFGQAVCLAISSAAVGAMFYFTQRALKGPQVLEFDRKTYNIDDSYAQGCKEFLTACINFGLLMNRLVRPERGRPFTADGNPTNGELAYSTRMEHLLRHIKIKQQEQKAKELRQIEK